MTGCNEKSENRKITKLFCYLETDQKTIELIRIFYNVIVNRENSIEIENRLQLNEIWEHIFRNSSHTQNFSSQEWVSCYAQSFRSYLNTLKVASLFIYMRWQMNKECSDIPIDNELIISVINMWNDNKISYIDTVFL